MMQLRSAEKVDLGRCTARSKLVNREEAVILRWTAKRWSAGRRSSDARRPSRYNPCRRLVPLTDEQRGLATRYLPMAQALARRMEEKRHAERDELQSIAYLALVEAAQSFDSSYKVNFATYARCHIRGALRRFTRRARAARQGGDGARPIEYRELRNQVEKHAHVVGIEPDWPVGTEIESFEAIDEWLGRLPGMLAAICRLIYIDGLSQEQTAEFLGCSKSHLSRLHREAMAWLVRQRDAALARTKTRACTQKQPE